MPRLQLELPTRCLYRTTLQVRASDLNYGNHLGNAALLLLLQEARLLWLRANGLSSEIDVGGCGLIQTDCAVVYQNEAYLGDTLQISLLLGERSRTHFDLYYAVLRNSDETLIAQAKTNMACFDYAKRKPARIPAALLTLLDDNESAS